MKRFKVVKDAPKRMIAVLNDAGCPDNMKQGIRKLFFISCFIFLCTLIFGVLQKNILIIIAGLFLSVAGLWRLLQLIHIAEMTQYISITGSVVSVHRRNQVIQKLVPQEMYQAVIHTKDGDFQMNVPGNENLEVGKNYSFMFQTKEGFDNGSGIPALRTAVSLIGIRKEADTEECIPE